MATFTMVLKDVLDIEPDIGLNDYPIFDEAYRPDLNQKIIDHFWNREIGQETIDLFRFALKRKMNEVMPYYNQHYLASQLKFDPLKTVDLKTLTENTGTVTSSGEASSNSTSDAKSRAVSSELPQMQLSGNGDYATAAQDNVSGTAATGASTETGKQEQDGSGESSTSGYQGVPAELVARYRETLVNVDMMVINDLQELFMQIWDNGDSFAGRNYGLGYFGYYGISF